MTTFWKPRQWAVPLLLVVALLCAGQVPLPEPVTDQELSWLLVRVTMSQDFSLTQSGRSVRQALTAHSLDKASPEFFAQAVRARLRARTAFRLHTDQPCGFAQCLIR